MLSNRYNIPSAAVLFCLMAALASGCINPGIRRNVDVVVLDAETDRPINNANVTVRPGPRMLNVPIPGDDVIATTDAAGQATIATPKYLFPVWIDWHVEANGYETAWHMSDGGRVPSKFLEKRSWLAWRQQATVRLTRSPGPEVALIVPDGYRGPIFVDVVPDDWPSASPIAETPPRHYTFLAADNGYVRVAAYPILAHKPYMPHPRWEERIAISEVSGRKIKSPTGRTGHEFAPMNTMLRWVASQVESETRARHLFYFGDLAGQKMFATLVGDGHDRDAKIEALFDEAEAAATSNRK
jgi:hypothetical protein